MYKIKRLIGTIKYLKRKQIFFRLYYIFRKNVRYILKDKYSLSVGHYGRTLSLTSSISSATMNNQDKFIFLNISYRFSSLIDWNYLGFGKLWTYNLNYFEYLSQENISKGKALQLIYSFIDQINTIKDGLEPFPISLRGVNWIKYISFQNIHDNKIDNSLYRQYEILMDNVEYHLLGNHLLENAFSLLFAAYYFEDEEFYLKASKILTNELDEQIMDDGAHFELSTMYHQIILYRILDCINLIQNNNWKKQELISLFVTNAEVMLGWINTITYKNGNIPLLNDSANKIAPTTKELNEYANRLNVKMSKLILSDSGYRKIENKNYEMVVDIGNIGPDYIPGHAHSDTFNFELYIEGKPFIVDSGISTYETNERRLLERSTASHNTVQLDDLEQSEVWSSFRVSKRAYIIDIEEKNSYIRAIHDGYKQRVNALHQREFLFEEKVIKIIDTIISDKKHNAISRIHFYPDIEPTITSEGVNVGPMKIKIKDSKFKILEYNYAPEFNTLLRSKMLEISFNNKLEIEIIL